MNYYEKHLGDYAKNTSHLSMLEHGAYNMLLDRYYATQSGIPKEHVYRVTKANSRAEKSAVDEILKEFFYLEDGLYKNKRAEQEIAKFLEKKPAADQKREATKQRVEEHRKHRKALFDELSKHGVTPPWNTKTSELETLFIETCNSTCNALQVEPVTQNVTLCNAPVTVYHTPVTNPQSPIPRHQY